MAEYVTIPLDIEGVKVNRVEVTDNGEVHIHVSSTVDGTRCHRCGRDIHRRYDEGREIKLRHLPILDMPTYIFLKPRRYVCDGCPGNPTTTQHLPWYEPRHAVTKAYAEHVLRLLVNSTVQDVSEKERIGYDEVEDIVEGQFGQGVDWKSFSSLPTLGIDEIALKKGHRDFATVVTVRTEEGKNRLLGVLENREKATVKAFFLSMPNDLRDTVQSVCSDLYEGLHRSCAGVFWGRCGDCGGPLPCGEALPEGGGHGQEEGDAAAEAGTDRGGIPEAQGFDVAGAQRPGHPRRGGPRHPAAAVWLCAGIVPGLCLWPGADRHIRHPADQDRGRGTAAGMDEAGQGNQGRGF